MKAEIFKFSLPQPLGFVRQIDISPSKDFVFRMETEIIGYDVCPLLYKAESDGRYGTNAFDLNRIIECNEDQRENDETGKNHIFFIFVQRFVEMFKHDRYGAGPA